ncbi:hypothetical protein [Nocardioides hwasunensis]|uniref:Transporter n=1 Tax=Nocardioides hwasunensis TaxID=397258 RepID=A0ABR8MHE1_9ACTN|nr:hypothetical protein [Nocardioides hwasunensis]MBD3914182.1 hypothetical protein [Nocardioides hwasunensis]
MLRFHPADLASAAESVGQVAWRCWWVFLALGALLMAREANLGDGLDMVTCVQGRSGCAVDEWAAVSLAPTLAAVAVAALVLGSLARLVEHWIVLVSHVVSGIAVGVSGGLMLLLVAWDDQRCRASIVCSSGQKLPDSFYVWRYLGDGEVAFGAEWLAWGLAGGAMATAVIAVRFWCART